VHHRGAGEERRRVVRTSLENDYNFFGNLLGINKGMILMLMDRYTNSYK
jgi:hypothetical protein